jgi:hypothetical protein
VVRPPARYVVWRVQPGLPPGWMPEGLEGRWEPREVVERLALLPYDDTARTLGPVAVARPVDRYEVREDGEVAQVWIVRP